MIDRNCIRTRCCCLVSSRDHQLSVELPLIPEKKREIKESADKDACLASLEGANDKKEEGKEEDMEPCFWRADIDKRYPE